MRCNSDLEILAFWCSITDNAQGIHQTSALDIEITKPVPKSTKENTAMYAYSNVKNAPNQ